MRSVEKAYNNFHALKMDVAEYILLSFTRSHPEDEGSIFFRNVETNLLSDTV
jgi:hypothetical protein